MLKLMDKEIFTNLLSKFPFISTYGYHMSLVLGKPVYEVCSQITFLILNLTEKPFNTFANNADPDQAALVRAVDYD